MKTVALNILIAITGLSLALAGDYMYVNSEEEKELVKYSNWLSLLGFLVIPIGFYWVNFLALSHKRVLARATITTFITFVLSGFWLLLAFTVIGNFHLSIGGKL